MRKYFSKILSFSRTGKRIFSEKKSSFLTSLIKFKTVRSTTPVEPHNKIVRVIRADKANKIARIKHHEMEKYKDEEVFFKDLETVSPEQAKEYFQKKSSGLVPNFAQQIGNTLLMEPSKFFTVANSSDIAKALGKGVNYRDIQRKMDLEEPISIKASLLDIITSSDKSKKQVTGKEALYDTFNSLASKGIAFIERDFLFKPLIRGGARPRKGESKTDFAERKTTAQLNAEQDIRKTAGSTFTKYSSTYDPQTKKGDPSYPIDHIAKGLEFPSGETKSGEFIAANLISKSLRMASDRELTSWLESQGVKDKGLNEKNLKRAQNLASQLGIKGTQEDKSGNLYFGQEDADIWGMSKGYVPNFAKLYQVFRMGQSHYSPLTSASVGYPDDPHDFFLKSLQHVDNLIERGYSNSGTFLNSSSDGIGFKEVNVPDQSLKQMLSGVYQGGKLSQLRTLARDRVKAAEKTGIGFFQDSYLKSYNRFLKGGNSERENEPNLVGGAKNPFPLAKNYPEGGIVIPSSEYHPFKPQEAHAIRNIFDFTSGPQRMVTSEYVGSNKAMIQELAKNMAKNPDKAIMAARRDGFQGFKDHLIRGGKSTGFIPNFASTTLYRGTSPKYDKAVRDIPNPPQFLFDEIMAANTKSDFIKAVKKLGISHSMGAYSGSYNDGIYPATIEQMRGHEEMDENQILHGGYVYPRPMRGGFGKQEGVDLTPRHQPSGFVSRTVDKDVARDFAKSMHPGYEYDPNEMGNVEEVSVPNKRIFDQTKLEKYIDRFGLENVKKSFKQGMRKGTLKDIYLNLHKFRPKVQSTDPLDMFSPNAGESDRSIGMSGGSLARDEKEITHIWSKRSPYFGQYKGLIPNFNEARKVHEQMFGTLDSRTKDIQNRNKVNREKALRGQDPKLFDRHYPDPILGQTRRNIINAPIGGGERNVAQAIRASKRIENSKKEELIKQIGSQKLKDLDEKYLNERNENSHISRLRRFEKQRKDLESAVKSENFEKAGQIRNADFIANEKIYNEYASYLGATRYLDSDVSVAKRAQERFGRDPHSDSMNDPSTLGYYPGITKSYGTPGEKTIYYNPYKTNYANKGPRSFRSGGSIPNLSLR